MEIHLVDGTYELFRHYFAVPSQKDVDDQEVGAVVGVLGSILGLMGAGATHVGVATDHIVESFRNDLWPEYKTGEGMDPELHRQFGPLEVALTAMGVLVWPMKELEADDGMASAAVQASADERVSRIFMCTPDKDLSQCVVGDRVVQLDRRQRTIRNEAGVVEKFGVLPTSIPDYLALVGDSADGFPGIAGWGAKSSATVLACYHHLESIPRDASDWEVKVRGAAKLADRLATDSELAFLFRDLATLRTNANVFKTVDDLRWIGPTAEFTDLCARLGAPALADRATALARSRT